MTSITLQEALTEYLDHLKQTRKSERTLYTYGKDCEQILAFFGSSKQLRNMLPAHVAGFLKSDELLKIQKSGKDRAPATVQKTRRVLCTFLHWAKEQEYISNVPLPKS